jgi:peroxiredoxin Q/BCP
MQSAPAFSLKNQDSKMVSLSDYAGQWLLLYFYPKDDTPGCTKEACNFRDWKDYLQEKGLQVVGVSKDSPSSHLNFVKKHSLNFTILSDPEAIAIKAYGAFGEKKMFGRMIPLSLFALLIFGCAMCIIEKNWCDVVNYRCF